MDEKFLESDNESDDGEQAEQVNIPDAPHESEAEISRNLEREKEMSLSVLQKVLKGNFTITNDGSSVGKDIFR